MSRTRRFTLQARLTLIYGGLFLAAGVLLLGLTYALFNQQLSRTETTMVSFQPGSDATFTTGAPGVQAPLPDDDLPNLADAQRWIVEQREILRYAATTSLLAQGGIALALVGGLAAGLGWLAAGRVLAPLHRVTDTARRIAAVAEPGLHERIALRSPNDEVKDLADAFDTMVARLDRSFAGQRRFVANASHELRTPLTVGRALVELAMYDESASPDIKQLGRSLLQINARHERLIAGLLLLARSENEITARHPVDLADLVTQVVGQYRTDAERAGLACRANAAEAPTIGDALLLERLVHNLVENAIRHNTGPGGWIEVESRTRPDGRAELTVSNTGPVVPDAEVPALFEPFLRLDTGRTVTATGAGLGLSIVRSVAHAHNGEATAAARDGGGLIVTVTLPGCPLPLERREPAADSRPYKISP